MSKSGVTIGTPPATLPRRSRLALAIVISVMGSVVLAFILGAGVMFFQIPPYEFLAKGFLGGRAWYEQSLAATQTRDQDLSGSTNGIDKFDKTFDGFTLCAFATLNADNTQAFLLDMKRQIKHRWGVKFSQIWPNPKHVQGPVQDMLVCFFSCHLYPSGDLLVVLHGVQQVAVGYGLIKLDRDSNVIWSLPANIHHDVDVAPDGTIYAIEHHVVNSMPSGLQFIPTPCLIDHVIALTPDGQQKGKPISVLEAFRDTPYAELLASLEPGRKKEDRAIPVIGPGLDEKMLQEDAVHTNSVMVLTPEMAKKFPAWKPGQLLLSLRNLDVIAVLDPETRSIVWAARGPWQAQHDLQFLENGHLLIFDNRGLPKGSRVLEFDPFTLAFPWSYSGENRGAFYSSERGLCQRLPNGNTLVVNTEGEEILEVSAQKEVVWTFTPHRYLTYGRRYSPSQVQFLPGISPRP
jgi:hypothetical protein